MCGVRCEAAGEGRCGHSLSDVVFQEGRGAHSYDHNVVQNVEGLWLFGE